MRGRPTASAPARLSTLSAMFLGGLLALVTSIGVIAATGTKADSDSEASAAGFSRLDQRPGHRDRCAASGLATVSDVPQALIRDARGRLRLVSFERGWEIFTGERRGTLVAVCGPVTTEPPAQGPATRP